ncbi:ArsC/Spx/MgsR family protein [Campylobacter sp. CCS1377]|uniref:ArsC/Spx/MgsR family protein n=1 Tax=Campylobacter sp. CCS1377 TaxID=3158229 RepID=A0AAU7E9P1_9BACT|nr:ArsC family transcriptional regulator [Campylobacter jejuni]
MKIYGIKNCNSVQKGLEFFKNKGIGFEFLDIKKIDESILNSWLEKRSFIELINSAGTSAKKLGLNKEKIQTLDKEELKKIVMSNLSTIKRPVVEKEGKIFIGKEYENLDFKG